VREGFSIDVGILNNEYRSLVLCSISNFTIAFLIVLFSFQQISISFCCDSSSFSEDLEAEALWFKEIVDEPASAVTKRINTINRQLKYALLKFRSRQEAIVQCKESISRLQKEIAGKERTIRFEENLMKYTMEAIQRLNRRKREAVEEELQETERLIECAAEEMKPTAVISLEVTAESQSSLVPMKAGNINVADRSADTNAVATIKCAEDTTAGAKEEGHGTRSRKRRR
jgi:hypothetical protein